MIARRRWRAVPTWAAIAGGLACAAATQTTAQTAAPDPTRPGPPFVNTADPAAPDAREIVQDIPNALHWSRQQRGQLGEWHYVFFPDGTARVLQGADRKTIAAELTCEAGVACHIRRRDGTGFTVEVGRGARPELPARTDLDSVARYLAAWLLAGTAPPLPPEQPTEPEPASLPAVPLSDAAGTPPPAIPTPPAGTASDQTRTAEAGAAPERVDSTDATCAAPDPFMPDACAVAAAPPPDAPDGAPGLGAARLPGLARPAPVSGPTSAASAEGTPKARPSLIERFDISCSVTMSAGLAGLASTGGSDSRGVAKPRASLGCGARLTEKLTLRTSLIGYFNPDQQRSWDPDYTYALSYRFSDSITLSYSNYSARFRSGDLAGLLDGTLRATYRLPPLPLGTEKELPCSASLGLPRPDRTAFSLSCSYLVAEKLRLGASTHLYLADAQDTYQPDYTYTASYRINDDWLVSYQNYSNNRFPWNRGEDPGPGFTGGSVSVTYQMAF